MNNVTNFVDKLEAASWVETLEVNEYEPILVVVVNGVELTYTPSVLRDSDVEEIIDLARVQVFEAKNA